MRFFLSVIASQAGIQRWRVTARDSADPVNAREATGHVPAPRFIQVGLLKNLQ